MRNRLISHVTVAIRGVRLDQGISSRVGGSNYRARHPYFAILLEPGLRAGLLMRLASNSGPKVVTVLARTLLLRNFSCDMAASAIIEGGVYLPHPVGIVIGAGVTIGDGARLYQHVTLGAGAKSGYPRLGTDVTVYPYALIAGALHVGDGSRIGARVFLRNDVAPGSTVRASDALGG